MLCVKCCSPITSVLCVCLSVQCPLVQYGDGWDSVLHRRQYYHQGPGDRGTDWVWMETRNRFSLYALKRIIGVSKCKKKVMLRVIISRNLTKISMKKKKKNFVRFSFHVQGL